MDTDELDDKHWDELPVPLQEAAAKLGYSRKLWDNDQEPDQCDRNWSELISEQQKAARLLGYTPKKWDEEVYTSESGSEPADSRAAPSGLDDDGVDAGEQLENRIKTLKDEITHRQKKLKTLLREKEGTVYARMLQSHEDCVNSHLQESLTNFHPDYLLQNQSLSLKQSPLQLIRTIFLNEFYHTLPGCAAIIFHCLLYSTLTDLVSKLAAGVCNQLIAYLTGWHIINNNFDDSTEEHIFFFIAILFSFSLLRATGALYDWNENREFQRKIKFHFRNRWHLKCLDMRIMNWFSGGEIRDMYDKNTRTTPGPNNTKGGTLGPRMKHILDVFCFFLLYCCVDHLVEEFGPKLVLNMKETVLEGLPSRQMHQQRSRNLGHGQREQYCIGSGSDNHGTEECLDNLEMDFMPDIWNWVTNSDRCGWVNDEQDEEDHSEYDACPQKQYNASSILSVARGRGPNKFKPWKQADEEWKRMVNIRDDEYLRASISMESYYSLVGDPDAQFIDPVREQLFLIAITGMSLGCLYWFEIPFLLI